jgi:protein-disulfide isomerase
MRLPLLTSGTGLTASVFAAWLAASAGAFAGPPSDDTPVAIIGEKSVSYAELRAQTDTVLGSQQRQYDTQRRRLDVTFARARQSLIETELGKLIDAKVLELEAVAGHTTPAALLTAIKPAAIAESESKAFYDARKDQIEQPYEAVAAQIRQHLQAQADEKASRRYLDSLRTKYHATTSLEPLREPVATTGPQRGAAGAAVTIVEFSDFECPFCARFTPVLAQLQSRYPGKVRVVYRYFPLASIHPDAQKAAEAAVCADRQGKFWPMHDALFADQTALGIAQLKATASRLGLDVPRFDECLDGGAGAAVVAADQAAGEDLAIASTPSSFVNGRFVKGAWTFDQMQTLVEDELRRGGHPQPSRQ